MSGERKITVISTVIGMMAFTLFISFTVMFVVLIMPSVSSKPAAPTVAIVLGFILGLTVKLLLGAWTKLVRKDEAITAKELRERKRGFIVFMLLTIAIFCLLPPVVTALFSFSAGFELARWGEGRRMKILA